jgi:GT2 family glycosyltransferase
MIARDWLARSAAAVRVREDVQANVDIAGAPPVAAAPKRAIEVIFASKGRPEILAEVVNRMRRQSRKPDSIIVSCPSLEDAGCLVGRRDVKIVLSPLGLPRQRNAALRKLEPRTEIVVFFDDDFIAHPDWIANVEREFHANVQVAAITGNVLADGIKGVGLTIDEAERALSSWSSDGSRWSKDYSPYGCNMAFRRSAIEGVFFDERLVLYGWLEDRDFGGALRLRGGRTIKLGSACGVHLGQKTARLPGRKLGYSQVVNPLYLHRKGTMTLSSVVKHLFGNLSSNILRSLAPETHIDRAGRLRGNIIGLREVILGTAAPERAERL